MDYVRKARVGRLVALGKSNAVRTIRKRPILFQENGLKTLSEMAKPKLVSRQTEAMIGDELATA